MLGGALRLRHADPLARRTQWLAAGYCAEMLERQMPVIGAPTRQIAASLLAKRIAFLATGACLYAMTLYDKGLNLAAENCLLDERHQGGVWQSDMQLWDIRCTVPKPGQREIWRQEVVTSLFAGHLAPLWQVLNEVSGIAPAILWENTAVRVFSLYERRIAQASVRQNAVDWRQDFLWLITSAPGSVFGCQENPLRRYWRSPLLIKDGAGERYVRFRRTCCFYYQATEPAEYCSTCPLLRPEKKAGIKTR